jgi:hypothetical protein
LRRNTDKTRSALSLEIDTVYPIPFIEGIVFTLSVLAFFFVSDIGFGIFARISPSPEWNGIPIENLFTGFMNQAFIMSLGRAFNSFTYVLLFIVPVLVTLDIARGLESGFFRTWLSYPIGRRKLLLLKVMIVMILVTLPVNVASVLGALYLEPGVIPVDEIIVLSSALWAFSLMVTSISVILAVLTKSLPVTLFGGVGIPFSLASTALLLRDLPAIIRALFNPLFITMTFTGSNSASLLLENVLLGIVGSAFVGLILLACSVLAFDRMEM